MAEEEEVAASTEKVIRIQRVFINLLDSYSSRNIGKVSSGGLQQDSSPRTQPPNLAKASATGSEQGFP